jgi:hypothetical protein
MDKRKIGDGKTIFKYAIKRHKKDIKVEKQLNML